MRTFTGKRRYGEERERLAIVALLRYDVSGMNRKPSAWIGTDT